MRKEPVGVGVLEVPTDTGITSSGLLPSNTYTSCLANETFTRTLGCIAGQFRWTVVVEVGTASAGDSFGRRRARNRHAQTEQRCTNGSHLLFYRGSKREREMSLHNILRVALIQNGCQFFQESRNINES